MEYPNKIYVSEYNGANPYGGQSHFVVVVAASSRDVAKQYVKEMIGFDVEPTWLMNAVYPTIYSQTGNDPLDVQVKILSNNTQHS
jgi:hypothetical protein